MMKLMLLVLFFTLCSVQPSLTDKTVIASSGKILYYENSTSTFICTKTHAIWSANNKNLTECNCPGKCGDILFDETRITAYCNGSSPILHFKQMKLDDNYDVLRCAPESSWVFKLLVGRRSDDFYPKEPFALINNNYTLVWEKKMEQAVYLYNDKKVIGTIASDNYIDNMDEDNFDITIDQLKIKLLIKKVALKDDGKIFGCYPVGSHLSLLNLTVNVPVSSVSLHQETKGFLIEDENGIFICKVDQSKPKASFKWILSENGSEREITQNIDITSKQNGKLWQTTSTLKLKLKRNFKTIKCRAKIQGMAWTNFKSLQLDVKYPPPGKPQMEANNSEICVGETIRIRCEWTGGHPAAFVNLTCLSKTNEKKDVVTITETVTRKMSNRCSCQGKHIVKNMNSTYDLNIQYPPSKVVINQTSYLKGKPSSLICNASGGSPDLYTYSWSPGNYPSTKEINITLTQVAADQKFTCKVANRNCGRNNPISSSIKIIVEEPPIIKMNNSLTVIENETTELKCNSEGNPKPINMWRIGNEIINSSLLRTSFTRRNASGGIQCIAIANSAKHGILKTVKNISIVVTYAPEITISYKNPKINCSATASPSNITYVLVQKWGNIEKRKFNGSKMVFQNLTYQDSGEWICRASNGVPTKTKKKYSKKSVEVKVDVQAQFSGEKTEHAINGNQKSIKVCFYCHPEATAVEWHNEHGKLSSDKSVYSPADEGLFPFIGNCSTLTLDITAKSAKKYDIKVTNKIGKSEYSVKLVIKEEEFNYLNVFIPIAVLLILIIICGGIGFYKYRSYTKEKQSKNNLVDNNNSGNDMMENSLYSGVTNNTDMMENSLYSGVTNNAATDIEPLYAQVNKAPKKLSKRTNANIEELYAKVDKSKKPQNKNATDIEPLYAQVNKPPKKLSKRTNENVEDLYAKVDNSKKPQNQKQKLNQKPNVEELYAQVDKSKKPKDKNLLEGNNSLYANVDEVVPDKKTKKKVPKKSPPVPAKPKLEHEPAKDIYENLEMQQKKTDGDQELMYADLDFIEKGDNKKQKPVKKTEETMYAAIDFSDI